MNDNEKHNDGLDILLREAVRSREEILHHMEDCSNKIFALSNISLVLLGAYVTSILLMGADKRIVVFPFLLAAGLAMGGLTAGLLAMFPRYYDIIIVPNELYGLKIEKKEDIMDKILQTYLVQENKLLLRAGEKPFFLKIIATFMIGSIVAFFVVIFTIVFDVSSSRTMITTSISLIILAAVLSMVVINMRTYKKRRNNIKKKLEA